MSIVELIPRIVLWLVVPIIIVSLLIYSAGLASGSNNRKLRSSSVAGFWAGIVLALIYIVSQLNNVLIPELGAVFFPDFNLTAIIVGIFIGFVLLAIVGWFSESPVVGLAALILSATSTSALFSYFFLPSFRDTVMYIALGSAFGALLYKVFSPMFESLVEKR